MKMYAVILRDGDGQPLTDYCEFGMKSVRERVKIARDDWSHYPRLQVLVKDGDGVCIIDRTYKSKAGAL